MRVLWQAKLVIPDVEIINSYYDHEGMIDVFIENAKKFDLKNYDHVLISFHGLPVRHLKKADMDNHCLKKENCCSKIGPHNQFCYSAQCHGTAQAIARKLNLSEDQYTICYQSRLGKEVWQEPYTSDVLETQAKKGAKRLLVFCPAFVADCLETTVEVEHEYAEEFQELGGETVDLVASLNDHPGWVNAVCEMIKEKSPCPHKTLPYLCALCVIRSASSLCLSVSSVVHHLCVPSVSSVVHLSLCPLRVLRGASSLCLSVSSVVHLFTHPKKQTFIINLSTIFCTFTPSFSNIIGLNFDTYRHSKST